MNVGLLLNVCSGLPRHLSVVEGGVEALLTQLPRHLLAVATGAAIDHSSVPLVTLPQQAPNLLGAFLPFGFHVVPLHTWWYSTCVRRLFTTLPSRQSLLTPAFAPLSSQPSTHNTPLSSLLSYLPLHNPPCTPPHSQRSVHTACFTPIVKNKAWDGWTDGEWGGRMREWER